MGHTAVTRKKSQSIDEERDNSIVEVNFFYLFSFFYLFFLFLFQNHLNGGENSGKNIFTDGETISVKKSSDRESHSVFFLKKIILGHKSKRYQSSPTMLVVNSKPQWRWRHMIHSFAGPLCRSKLFWPSTAESSFHVADSGSNHGRSLK